MYEATHKQLKLFVPESLLSRLMDDEDLMRQVLDACLPDLTSNLDLFKAKLADGDLVEARRVIHSMKGSAQNSDLKALAALTMEIEDALKNGDSDFARDRQEDLSSVVEDSIRAVEGYFTD